MSFDQRFYCRIPYAGDVMINGSILVNGSNISEDGMYVNTGRPFLPGSTVRVEFSFGGRDFSTAAKIRSCDGSIGMGLNFTELKYAEREYIRHYVEENYGKTYAEQKKVLIVEDNAAIRKMYKTRLGLDGYRVEEAQDGLEAIGKMQAVRPDVVVLDLYMERMDGYKVLAHIRGSAALKNTPVIIFSARGTKNEIDRAMSAGASKFLPKTTTSPVRLSEDIKKLLNVSHKAKKIA